MQTPEWLTADGVSIHLPVMTSDHLRNAMEYIRRGNGQYGPLVGLGVNGFTYEKWRVLMANELACRARSGRD